jgi:putative transposase
MLGGQSSPRAQLGGAGEAGKAELVYGPDADGWDDIDELELATLSWVHWFNNERLHGHCDDVLPAEFEAAFYAAQQADQTLVGNQ